jgi:hypothetical protein
MWLAFNAIRPAHHHASKSLHVAVQQVAGAQAMRVQQVKTALQNDGIT